MMLEWVLILYLATDEISFVPIESESACLSVISGLAAAGGGTVSAADGTAIEIIWAVCAPAETTREQIPIRGGQGGDFYPNASLDAAQAERIAQDPDRQAQETSDCRAIARRQDDPAPRVCGA